MTSLRYLIFSMTFSIGTLAFAATLGGSVLNGTVGRPSGGDEVVLLSLGQDGMTEVARTNVDRSGHFRFVISTPQESYLVRVVHQGVTYHKVAEAGAQPVSVQVYDVAEKVDGLRAVIDVQRFEATDKVLEVKQLVTIRNASKPPRTLMNARPFEIQLPPEAEVESGLVQISEGQPLKQQPVQGEQKGQYYFPSPIRPGDTRFAVVYRLPYRGEAVIEPHIRNPLEKLVVMLPKSMKFEPRDAAVFQSMPGTTPDNVQGTAPLLPSAHVAFRISGSGMLEELQGRRNQAKENKEATLARPGGGLGAPTGAPDPLHEVRWFILGGFALLLIGGGAWTVGRASRIPEELFSGQTSRKCRARGKRILSV